MQVLKPQGQGLLKFCITVYSVMKELLYFFYLKPLYFEQKEPVEVKKLLGG